MPSPTSTRRGTSPRTTASINATAPSSRSSSRHSAGPDGARSVLSGRSHSDKHPTAWGALSRTTGFRFLTKIRHSQPPRKGRWRLPVSAESSTSGAAPGAATNISAGVERSLPCADRGLATGVDRPFRRLCWSVRQHGWARSDPVWLERRQAEATDAGGTVEMWTLDRGLISI